MLEIDKDTLERTNIKLGHFLILNEVAVKQKGRSITRKEKKACAADRKELVYLIEKIGKILNPNYVINE